MAIREEVQQLVDGLSESELVWTRCFIKDLSSGHDDARAALDALLANCEDDDEPLTEEDLRAVEESRQAYRRGEFITHGELIRRRLVRQGR